MPSTWLLHIIKFYLLISFWNNCSKCNAPTQKRYKGYIFYVVKNGNVSLFINQKKEEKYMRGKSGIWTCKQLLAEWSNSLRNWGNTQHTWEAHENLQVKNTPVVKPEVNSQLGWASKIQDCDIIINVKETVLGYRLYSTGSRKVCDTLF